MAGLRDAEDAVAAADAKLVARMAQTSLHWRSVKTGARNMLTGPAMIGGVAAVAAVMGARKPSPPARVECKCVKASPSVVRVVLLAMVSPILENVVATALKQFGAAPTAGSQSADGHEPAGGNAGA